MLRSRSVLGAIALAALCASAPVRAQIPEKFENLKVLPRDIARDSLVQIMRGFSFALNVRCQHCHTGGDGVSFEGVNFASDDKPAKRNARFMLGMVAELNNTTLANIPERSTPPVRVECATCHHGMPKPATLAQVLTATIEQKGIDSAVQQYRDLRTNQMVYGRFDFGEWSINELARVLTGQGKTLEAVRFLELNSEFYPTSPAIDQGLADLYRQRGEKDKALARYRMLLQKQPNNPMVKRRIEELTKP